MVSASCPASPTHPVLPGACWRKAQRERLHPAVVVRDGQRWRSWWMTYVGKPAASILKRGGSGENFFSRSAITLNHPGPTRKAQRKIDMDQNPVIVKRY